MEKPNHNTSTGSHLFHFEFTLESSFSFRTTQHGFCAQQAVPSPVSTIVCLHSLRHTLRTIQILDPSYLLLPPTRIPPLRLQNSPDTGGNPSAVYTSSQEAALLQIGHSTSPSSPAFADRLLQSALLLPWFLWVYLSASLWVFGGVEGWRGVPAVSNQGLGNGSQPDTRDLRLPSNMYMGAISKS